MKASLLFPAVVVLVVISLISAPVWAQSSDPAAAEALFQKGRDAMDRDDFDTACEMFEESFALDAAAGTVMNLAVCEEKRGQLARSWERWHQALDLLEEDDDRVSYAVLQLESVEARLGYLTIVAKSGAPEELTLRRDDVVLGAAGLGQELPVDPGEHIIVVDSPGHESRRYTVTLDVGEHKELVVSPGRPLDQPGGDSAYGMRRNMGIAALGVGAAGLGVAITTGVLLPGQHRKVEDGCPSKRCTPEGEQAVSGAKTLLALNTVGWIAAGVGAAAGITLLVTLPKNNHTTARSSTNGTRVGLALSGNDIQVFGHF